MRNIKYEKFKDKNKFQTEGNNNRSREIKTNYSVEEKYRIERKKSEIPSN